MGGVPSVLLCLWCRGGCSTAKVAAALTFFPPNPPCYKLRTKEDSEELELEIDESIEATASTEGVQVARIISSRGARCGEQAPSAPPKPDGKGRQSSTGQGGSGGGGGHKDKGRKSSGQRPTGRGGSGSASHENRDSNGSSDSGSSRVPNTVGKIKGGVGRGSSVIPVALYRNANARFTLIYSHGNATDIGAMHDRCAGIAEAVGVNVLSYDYTGYGCASDSPTEARTYRDIEAVCAWARRNLLQEGEDGTGRNKGHGLILYGQSVGSGPTCYLASDRSKGAFAGVVLHSPILSGMRVLTESRALSCLDIYPNIDRASRLTCPVMIMHGKRDEEVPWEHGKGMYEAVPEVWKRRPWWVPDRGHNDICDGRRHLREYFSRLSAFVRSLDRDHIIAAATIPTIPATTTTTTTTTSSAATTAAPNGTATATPAESRPVKGGKDLPASESGCGGSLAAAASDDPTVARAAVGSSVEDENAASGSQVVR